MPHGGKHKTINPTHGSDMYGGGYNINHPKRKLTKREIDYVCKKSGGTGAFREFIDLILESKNW